MKKIMNLSLLLITCISVLLNTVYAEYNRDNHTYTPDNETEFGAQDDLVVLGTGGDWSDPDVEVYGFTIFGSTIGIIPKISASTGSVFIGGHLQVNSTSYIEGIEINRNNNVSKLKFTNGGELTGKLLKINNEGYVSFEDVSGVGDHLGNHIATTNLKMSGYGIEGVRDIKMANDIMISTATNQFGGVGGGIFISTNVEINGKLYIDREAIFGSSLNIPAASYLKFGNDGGQTDQILIRNSDGTMRWGNASSLVQGDHLGNHIATKNLDMASFEIVNIEALDMGTGLKISSATTEFGGVGAGIFIATHTQISGQLYVNNISTFDSNVQINNNLTVNGNTVLKSNVQIGDDSGDVLDIYPNVATLKSVTSGNKFEYRENNGATIAFFRKK